MNKHIPDLIRLRTMSADRLAVFIAALTDGVTFADIPEKLCTVEFADIWSRYLIDRENIRGEILQTDTVLRILEFLKYEPDPVACVEYAHRHGNKSIRPIDKIGWQYYKSLKPKDRYAERTSRRTRAHTRTSQKITETVFKPRPLFIQE